MQELQRTLNFKTTLAIVIGGIIGSGIFMKPSLMLSQLGSPYILLFIWLLAGCITLLGALSNAEAAALFPETGGQYVFFEKMYGKGFAFMYGWAAFAVFNTAGNASIAYVFAQYANYFIALPNFSNAIESGIHIHLPFIGDIFPLQNFGVKGLTILVVLLLSYINYRSVQMGGLLQRVLTALKIVAIVLLIAGIFFSGKGSFQHFNQTIAMPANSIAIITQCMAALAGAFWAFDGWNNITFIAGEIKRPQKNIPKSLLVGLCVSTVVYILVNAVLIYALPVQQMAKSEVVAADAATIAWGAIGGSIVALLVMLSTFGTTNANVLATARVTFTMGAENNFFKSAGKVHPVFKTPGNAIWFNAVWTTLLIISGSFDTLTDMLIFVSWFFYGMSAFGIIVLRQKYKNAEREYKVPAYPLVPLIFALFTLCFLAFTVYGDISNYLNHKAPIVNCLLGVAITLIGLPVYWLGRRKEISKDN